MIEVPGNAYLCRQADEFAEAVNRGAPEGAPPEMIKFVSALAREAFLQGAVAVALAALSPSEQIAHDTAEWMDAVSDAVAEHATERVTQ